MKLSEAERLARFEALAVRVAAVNRIRVLVPLDFPTALKLAETIDRIMNEITTMMRGDWWKKPPSPATQPHSEHNGTEKTVPVIRSGDTIDAGPLDLIIPITKGKAL